MLPKNYIKSVLASILQNDVTVKNLNEADRQTLSEILLDKIFEQCQQEKSLQNLDEKNRSDTAIVISIITMLLERLKREGLFKKPESNQENIVLSKVELFNNKIEEILPEIIAFQAKLIEQTSVVRALATIISATFIPEKYGSSYLTDQILISNKLLIDNQVLQPNLLKTNYLFKALKYPLTKEAPAEAEQKNIPEDKIIIDALRKELTYNTELVDSVALLPELYTKENLPYLVNLTSGRTSAHQKLAHTLIATSFFTANFSKHPSNDLSVQQIVQICYHQPSIISTLLKNSGRWKGRNYRSELLKLSNTTLLKMYSDIPEARTAILKDGTLIQHMLSKATDEQLAELYIASGLPSDQKNTIRSYILENEQYTKKAFDQIPASELINACLDAKHTLNERSLNNADITVSVIRSATSEQLLSLFDIKEVRDKIIEDKKPYGLLERVLDTASLGRTREGSSGTEIAKLYLRYPEIREAILAKRKVRENMLMFADVSGRQNDLLSLFEFEHSASERALFNIKAEILKNEALIERMLTYKELGNSHPLIAHQMTPKKLQRMYLEYPAIKKFLLAHPELVRYMLERFIQSDLIKAFERYVDLQCVIVSDPVLCDRLLFGTDRKANMSGERLLVFFEKYPILREAIANNSALRDKMLSSTPRKRRRELFEKYLQLTPALEEANTTLLTKKVGNTRLARWWFKRSLTKLSGLELADLLIKAIIENSENSNRIRNILCNGEGLVRKILEKATPDQLAELFKVSDLFRNIINADTNMSTRMLLQASEKQVASLWSAHQEVLTTLADSDVNLRDNFNARLLSGVSAERFEGLLERKPSGNELVKRFTSQAADHANLKHVIVKDGALINEMLNAADNKQLLQIYLLSYHMKSTDLNANQVLIQIIEKHLERLLKDATDEQVAEIYLLGNNSIRTHILSNLKDKLYKGFNTELSDISSELLLTLFTTDKDVKKFILAGSNALKFKLITSGITAQENLKNISANELAIRLNELTLKQKQQLVALLLDNENSSLRSLVFQRETEPTHPIEKVVLSCLPNIVINSANPKELLVLASKGQNLSAPIFTSGRVAEILQMATEEDIKKIFVSWALDTRYLPQLFLDSSSDNIKKIVDYVANSATHLRTMIAGISNQDIYKLFINYPEFRKEILTNANLFTFDGTLARTALFGTPKFVQLVLKCQELKSIILEDSYLKQKLLFAATSEELKELRNKWPELFVGEWSTFQKPLAAVEYVENFSASELKEETLAGFAHYPTAQLAKYLIQNPDPDVRKLLLSDDKTNGIIFRILLASTGSELAKLFLGVKELREIIQNDIAFSFKEKMLADASSAQLINLFLKAPALRETILSDKAFNRLDKLLVDATGSELASLFLASDVIREKILADQRPTGLFNKMIVGAKDVQCTEIVINYYKDPVIAVALKNLDFYTRARLGAAAVKSLEVTSSEMLFRLFLKDPSIRELVLNSALLKKGRSRAQREAGLEDIIFKYASDHPEMLFWVFLLDNVGYLRQRIWDMELVGKMLDQAMSAVIFTQLFLCGENKIIMAIAHDEQLFTIVKEYIQSLTLQEIEQTSVGRIELFHHLCTHAMLSPFEVMQMSDEKLKETLIEKINAQISILENQSSEASEKQILELKNTKEFLETGDKQIITEFKNSYIVQGAKKIIFEIEHPGLPYMATPAEVANVFMQPYRSFLDEDCKINQAMFENTVQAKIYCNEELLNKLERHAIELNQHGKTAELQVLLARVAIVFFAAGADLSQLPSQFKIMLRDSQTLKNDVPQQIFEGIHKRLNSHADEQYQVLREQQRGSENPLPSEIAVQQIKLNN